MNCRLYLYTTIQSRETWLKVYEILCTVYNENNLTRPSMGEKSLNIGAFYFNFFFMGPNELVDEEYYQFLEEEEKVKTNYNIYITFFNRKIEKGMPIFFQVIGELLKEFEGDMILLENGEFPVFERLNGEVFISGHYKEYQKELYSAETLSYLGVSYTEKEELDLL
ncbi:hypothetical protein [Enterococcus sp. AZ192]|uniref:hypothetical protein n=1 Tax=unclassified Enterococcus TaxID=2608891 RepID=UPI003D2A0D59